MKENNKVDFVSQATATANNYFHTGRPNKAIEMLSIVKTIDPNDSVAELMMQKICCDQFGVQPPDLTEFFGQNWLGENLDGKSIEIFCDQGMGDTINLLRYVKQLKKEYDCRVVLNYYAFYNQFERLLESQSDYIDVFAPFHIKCDYHTNIMSLPAIMNGIELYVYYPANFSLILKTSIPPQIAIDVPVRKIQSKRKIGIVWQTNADNPLSEQKSIDQSILVQLKSIDADFYCLQPLEFVSDWIKPLPIEDLHDTASFINACDCVITVDTAVLHLAGVLSKKTFALIPFDADPRWGESEKTVWYPNVEIFRQNIDLDWNKPLVGLKNRVLEFMS